MAAATRRAISNFTIAASAAGMPREQVHNLIKRGYLPFPKQILFHVAARECDHAGGPTKVGFGGARGPGKAMHIATPIPTMEGWKTMGTLQVGDWLFDEKGQPCQVLYVSEIAEGKQCYELTFSDGATLIADGEHLWFTLTRNERAQVFRRSEEYRAKRRASRPTCGTGKKPWLAARNQQRTYAYLDAPLGGIRTTEEIAHSLKDKKETNHSVNCTLPLDLPTRSLPITPYVLGVWLGDGSADGAKIWSNDAQVIDEIANCGFTVKETSQAYGYYVSELHKQLRLAGLLSNKHIPIEYLRASIVQRQELLRGLMDTDGNVDRDGYCEFTTTSKALAAGMYELLVSLGIKASMREGRATLYGKDCGAKYRFTFAAPFACFKLERKRKAQKTEGFNLVTQRRFITKVQPIASVPVRCISVSSPSKLFLAGRAMIPTHNTTTTFAQVTLDDCQRVPGLKCLFIRQTQKAARESFDDLRLRILRHTPHKYNHSSGILNFPNGSRVILGGFANDKDIEKFLGLEYDLIVIEEDTQLSKAKKDKLLTCLRTSKQNWRPRSYHTTNPGGLDHANFKREFIEPFRKNIQTVTRFIPSLSSDNPALNVEYIKHLRNLTGWLRKAWLDGDWDIAAGQFFTNFRYDRHVCKPFAIPANWPVWACLDYGFTHPTAAYLLTKGDGVIYVVAEHFRTKTLPATHADAIIKLFARHHVPLSRLKNFVAGADVFQMRGDTHGKTIADQYRAAGIRLRQAVQDREAGASLILSLLGDVEHDIPPKLQIFETCVNLIEQLPAMVHNPNHPEDVLKVDADEDGLNGDDCYDAFRYGVASEGGVGVWA